jgi:hypothetical protein
LGFAGGIGPDNIREQIKEVRNLVAISEWHGEYWLDMETKLRSEGDTQFDLKKCEHVLEISRPWFEEPKRYDPSLPSSPGPDHGEHPTVNGCEL